MCTIWEMAETIRAEEREAAARTEPSQVDARGDGADTLSQRHAAMPAAKRSRISAGLHAVAALVMNHRQRTQI